MTQHTTSVTQPDTDYSLTQHLTPYQVPLVRDLAWLIFSRDLITHHLYGYHRFLLQNDNTASHHWLNTFQQSLQDSPSLSARYMQQRQKFHRLGLYVEYLVQVWIKNTHNLNACPWQLIDHNIQIAKRQNSKRGAHTLGELDLLVRHKTDGYCIHVEAAVKFYLLNNTDITPASSTFHYDWRNWVGPKSHDRLDIKLHRMLSHQLPLGRRQETHNTLQNRTLPTIDASQLLLKGALLLPLRQYIQALSNIEYNGDNTRGNSTIDRLIYPRPLGLASNCASGGWLHYQQLQKIADTSSRDLSPWDLSPHREIAHNNWRLRACRPLQRLDWLGQSLTQPPLSTITGNAATYEKGEPAKKKPTKKNVPQGWLTPQQLLEHIQQQAPQQQLPIMLEALLENLSGTTDRYHHLRLVVVEDQWPCSN